MCAHGADMSLKSKGVSKEKPAVLIRSPCQTAARKSSGQFDHSGVDMADEHAGIQATQVFGELSIDRAAREVTVHGKPARLTPSELDVLLALTREPRLALSNGQLLEAMWGSAWASDAAALHVHVSRLRRKLGESGSHPRRIVTLHGFGYRFDPDGEDQHGSSTPATLGPVNRRMGAYILVSVDRIVEWARSELGSIVGLEPHDLVGTILYQHFHPEDQPYFLDARAELDQGNPTTLVGRILGVDGEYRLIEAQAQPIMGARGEILGFLGSFHALYEHGSPGGERPSSIRLASPAHPRLSPTD